MIDGVKIKPMTTHADDRGYFREILRSDEGLMDVFRQSSITKTNPGVVKAFHWHARQEDFWYVVDGMARAVLYDRRDESPTKGETQTVVMGEEYPVGLLIPRGVAHGYQVLGVKPVVLVYYTTECYDVKNPDELRIPWNDPTINYDWTIKNR
ncbi:dTDP-4-dehydrorhamnose 3,5-epimerase family protein [Candidatus Uhrbacteria bacterium]|nr:dTDP-4-dehydrorhamnose 3,5-epimerase family protein [Candidatus Uhrbacteria bacterium]